MDDIINPVSYSTPIAHILHIANELSQAGGEDMNTISVCSYLQFKISSITDLQIQGFGSATCPIDVDTQIVMIRIGNSNLRRFHLRGVLINLTILRLLLLSRKSKGTVTNISLSSTPIPAKAYTGT